MTPDDPRHGTYAGAQQHRRDGEAPCRPCHESFRRYQRRHANELKLGHHRNTPTGPVTAHLRALIRNGMTTQAIANQSGVGRSTIQDALTRPRPRMRSDNADALLQITPTGIPTGSVHSAGTIRRVQALGRLGWSMPAIVRTIHNLDPTQPITNETLRQLLHNRPNVVRYRTAAAVAMAYEELSMRIPEASRQTAQVRVRATRKGWPPPLAWNDIDTDDQPRGVGWKPRNEGDRYRGHDYDETVVERILGGDYNTPSTPVEKTAVCARWVAMGRSLNELERRTGWRASRYWKGDAA